MNFTMPTKYMPLSGRSFWSRQFSRAGATTARVFKRGLTQDRDSATTVVPEPGSPGGAPSKRNLYIGLGVAGALLLWLTGRRG